MITEQDMRAIASQVVNTYINIDWDPATGGYGNQCWDSINYINEHFFGLPRINTGNTAEKSGRWPGWAGNMVDCFPQTPAIAAAYELLPPWAPGLPGDTFVWDDSNREWFPSTHVATLVVDTGNGWPLFLSQNSSLARPSLPGYSPQSSGPVILQNLPRKGLLGIIRPRMNNISLAPAGDITQEDTLSQEEVLQVQGFTNSVKDAMWASDGVTQQLIVGLFKELVKKIEDSTYDLKVFDQLTDNFTGDRIIAELRAQTASLAAAVASSKAAQGATAEEIQKAVEDALAEGINFNLTVASPAKPEGETQ